MTHPNSTHRSACSRVTALEAVLAQGVCEEDAEYILGMIGMAYSRAVTNYAGVPLSNMRSNVDDDPLFRAALDHFLREMPRPVARPWWKFW